LAKLICGAILAVAIGAAAAQAQDYPTRPISIVVPYPAGGVTRHRCPAAHGADADRSRQADRDGEYGRRLGHGRRPAHVARATPDGYTLLLGNSEAFVLTPATMKLPYDPAAAFAPIALLPSYPFILVSTNDVPAKTLKELIAWIKANPQKVLQGTVGSGTAQQLCGVSMQRMIGTKWQLIPLSRRSARHAGHASRPDQFHVHRDRKLLAPGARRKDQGLWAHRENAVGSGTRYSDGRRSRTAGPLCIGVERALGACGNAPEIVAKLNVAADAAMADPTFHKRIVEMGLDMPPADQRTPEALEELRKADVAKWWPVIKAAGLKVE